MPEPSDLDVIDETQPSPSARLPVLLAICSDLDETPDADTYFETIRFLNTTEETRFGTGVGLEVGNTIYFDMPPGHFAYWSTTEENRERLRTLIRSGHIDCLHSFGDLATTRAHAGRALEELSRQDCHLKVWVDHAQAVTNFDPGIMKGHGAERGHVAYHADLTLQYGISHVWRGRVTSVIGQDRPSSFRAIGDVRHPISSGRTLAKELAKQVLGRLGKRKYAIHAPNRLTRASTLPDGQPVIEFLRCNPHWGGVSCADRGDRIHEVLTKRFLDRLVARGGPCILYTHLGKLDRNPDGRAFSAEAVAAFRLLAEYQSAGKIRTCTTRRLLQFASTGTASSDTLPFPSIN